MDADAKEKEAQRLITLRDFGILDSGPEEDFDAIARLAAAICETPVALVSLIDQDRQWFKARIGFDPAQTPLSQSICAHAIEADDILEIEDTSLDPRTTDNTLVSEPGGIRFYAGAPLRTRQGLALGALCVLDRVPRRLTDVQRQTLSVLADQVMRQIELRRALADADVLRREVDHRVKNSLQSIEALIRIQARQSESEDVRASLAAVQGRLATVSGLHQALYQTDTGASVDIAAFLATVVKGVAQQLPRYVKIDVDLAPLPLPSRKASALGMIVNEAVTNAAKYAFDGRNCGRISIRGQQSDGQYILTCTDDGPGLGTSHNGQSGLGLRIIEASAQQLGGDMHLPHSESGTEVRVVWPLD